MVAHQSDQFLMDDLDDMLGGRQALQHFGANRALRHFRDEILRNLIVDVGLKQRQTDFPHRGLDIGLAKFALILQLFEYRVEFIG